MKFDFANTKEKDVKLAATIIEEVAEASNVSVADIIGIGRRRANFYPRAIAILMVRDMTGLTLKEIGDTFGGRDHTTIVYSLKSAIKLLKSKSISASYDEVKAKVMLRSR